MEQTLRLVIEGSFDRLFRAPIHPIELMRALERALEEGVLVQGDHALAPNDYTARIDRQSYARFAGAQDRLERDFEQRLLELATHRRLRFVASPVVQLEVDPSLGERTYAIDAYFSDPDTSSGAAYQDESDPDPTTAMPSVQAAGWMLEIQSAGRPAQFLALSSDRYLLGRDEDNDIQLAEPAVSRRHAELRRDDDDFEVRDLRSTNGLLVNGERVESAYLDDGDVLQIGTTQLVMRRR